MAKKESKKTVETLTHEDARRKNIPTAEFQSVMGKEEQHPIRVVMPRGVAGLEKEKASRNRDLDPQLIWRGKDEQDWSDLVVHEGPGQWANEIIAGYFTPTRILFNGSKAVSLWR
jgi:adenine-specific DNA-methyltransferase